MSNESEIEREIVAKGRTAPRLSPSYVEAVIIGETFVVMPSGRTTVCELELRNGYTVRGESSCVSLANFDKEIGSRIARENARNKVWELEEYLLQQRLFENGAA